MSKNAGRHASLAPIPRRSLAANTASFAGAAFSVVDLRKAVTATATLSIASALLLNSALPANAAETAPETHAAASAASVQVFNAPASSQPAARAVTTGFVAQAAPAAAEPAPAAAPAATQTASASTQAAAVSASAKTAAAAPAPVVGSSVIDTALSLQGIPYVWGGASPATGFDCSGFVMYVFGLHGIRLPHSDSGQAAAGTPISQAQAQPGDLVHWPGHIGIYLGNGKVIHAPKPGDVVKISNLWGSPTFIRIG